MNISTKTLLELKCCECECYLSRSPIYVAENGTANCGRCPIPKGNAEKDQITYCRMIPYENLIKEIPFPCMYQNHGCSIKIPSKDSQYHEENCNYRPYICPMMQSGRCNWIGRKESLIEHFQTQHPDHLLDYPCILKHDYTKNSLEPYVTVFFNIIFLIITKVCLSTNKIYFSVYCFGDVANNLNTNFKLIVEREGDKIIKNGTIVPIAQKKDKENVFVSCGIHSLVDILNGSDKTTFAIHIKTKNKCVYCNSFYETVNENEFCETCDSSRIACKSCAFKDIAVKANMHRNNFCKFTKWCWVCNEHLMNFLDHHYDTIHKDVIYPEDNYWNVSKNDFKSISDIIFTDFIIDSKYDRFFGAIQCKGENYSIKICSGTLQSEKACKLASRVSIQNNSGDKKDFVLKYDFESQYDWNYTFPKNYLFLNNTSFKIKIEFF